MIEITSSSGKQGKHWSSFSSKKGNLTKNINASKGGIPNQNPVIKLKVKQFEGQADSTFHFFRESTKRKSSKWGLMRALT